MIARLIVLRVIVCVILLLAVNVFHIKGTSHVTNLHIYFVYFMIAIFSDTAQSSDNFF